jgi:hypothetical protein
MSESLSAPLIRTVVDLTPGNILEAARRLGLELTQGVTYDPGTCRGCALGIAVLATNPSLVATLAAGKYSSNAVRAVGRSYGAVFWDALNAVEDGFEGFSRDYDLRPARCEGDYQRLYRVGVAVAMAAGLNPFVYDELRDMDMVVADVRREWPEYAPREDP